MMIGVEGLGLEENSLTNLEIASGLQAGAGMHRPPSAKIVVPFT